MVKMILMLVATAFVAVVAEPPVGREYLPPSNTGVAIGRSSLSGRYNAPSTRYGAPSSFGRANGGLSGRYSTPSLASRRINGLSNRYSAPSATASRFGVPSNQYGAPSAAPSRFDLFFEPIQSSHCYQPLQRSFD
uniref:Uncharacterized protein n=1 Tax=Timema shepardi TaxID=629360 RepID=A0A7R9FZK4_TIMSH|nr:unnamed protein product [Timema shepardi]